MALERRILCTTLHPDERRHLLKLLESGGIMECSRTPDACGFTGEKLKPDLDSENEKSPDAGEKGKEK